MDLLTAATNVASLKKFVEEDMTSHFVTLQFGAAANALSGIEHAKDKKSVYWSAINHLESVEQGLKSDLTSIMRENNAADYLYVSAIKAAIYMYMGEKDLAEKCCDDSLQVVRTHNINFAKASSGSDLLAANNPVNWYKLVRRENAPLTKARWTFDAHTFWQRLIGRKADFTLHSPQGFGPDGPAPL
jgi:hypothetical protein